VLPTSSPLPLFAYPFLVLTFGGWIWTLLKAAWVKDQLGRDLDNSGPSADLPGGSSLLGSGWRRATLNPQPGQWVNSKLKDSLTSLYWQVIQGLIMRSWTTTEWLGRMRTRRKTSSPESDSWIERGKKVKVWVTKDRKQPERLSMGWIVGGVSPGAGASGLRKLPFFNRSYWFVG